MTHRIERRLLRVAALLTTGGMLFETTSCSQEVATLTAGAVSGWITAVLNNLIATYISELFNVSTGF